MDERSDDELLAATRVEPEAFAVFYRRHVDSLSRGTPPSRAASPLDEVKAGRAFTLVEVTSKGARLLGLVPDGTAQVDFANGGAHALLPVRENVVVQDVQGLTAADRVTVKFETRKPLVRVIDATAISGLATQAAEAVRGIGIEAHAESARPVIRRQTVVQVARPGAEPLAERVAQLLGGRIKRDVKTRVNAPSAPDVEVLLGSDRMR